MEKTIKISLVILLLGCLLEMPYGYYMLVRFVATCAFLLFSYNSKLKGHEGVALFYLVLALLFQPVFKIVLGRFIWNIVDVIVSSILIISLYSDFNSIHKTPTLKK
jgi:hypothetical protein